MSRCLGDEGLPRRALIAIVGLFDGKKSLDCQCWLSAGCLMVARWLPDGVMTNAWGSGVCSMVGNGSRGVTVTIENFFFRNFNF